MAIQVGLKVDKEVINSTKSFFYQFIQIMIWNIKNASHTTAYEP